MKIVQTTNLELIRRLNEELFSNFLLEESELKQAVWWVVKDNKEVIGFAGIKINPSKEKAFLCRAAVNSNYRGNGLQKRLINTRVRYAKRNGINRVYTYTWVENLASMRSLISCGFKPYYIEKSDATYIYLENESAYT